MLQNINKCYFQPVLQYNRENIEKINEICAPLKEIFGITAFSYFRLFNKGHYFSLSNNSFYQELVVSNDYFYNTEYLREQPRHLSKRKSNKFIWPDNIKDKCIESLQARNMQYACNIIKENEGTLEFYFFCGGKDSPLIKDLYISHPYILEDFITHFNKVSGGLIDASDIMKQGISPYLKEAYPQIESIFEEVTPWEKKIIEFNALLNSRVQEEICETRKRNNLTSRELQCLSYFSAGKTAKEIARVLNIGPRTVETYIANIRLKTKLQTKNELIHWFEDTFKNFLIKNKNINNYLIKKY